MSYTKTESVVQTAVLVIIMGFSVAGNMISMLVIYTNKQLRTPQYLLIFNLALSDVFTALICMPLTILTAIKGTWSLGNGLCKVQACSINTLFLCTIFTMTLMTVEKYFSLARPFSRFVTPKRTKHFIIGVWVFCLLLTMSPFLGWGRIAFNGTTFSCGIGFPKTPSEKSYLFFLATVGFVIPVIIMAISYARIYISVQNHSSRLLKFSYGKYAANVFRLQKHLILTTFFILVSFLICWTPFLLLIIYAAFSSDVSHIPKGLGVVAFWCGYSASAWNPIIYFARNRKFREKFTSLMNMVTSWNAKETTAQARARLSSKHRYVSWKNDDYLKGTQMFMKLAKNTKTTYV